MAWVKTVWAEFIGLFVDDGSLAVAVLVWLAVCWLILPWLGLPSVWPPALLFIGLVLILAESVMRRARFRI
jgi:hypothetical protein